MSDAWFWWERAACRKEDAELFFPADGERGPSRKAHDEKAKAVCRRCPVQARCLTEALSLEHTAESRHGVWGGLTAEERQLARRRAS